MSAILLALHDVKQVETQKQLIHISLITPIIS